MSIIGALLVVSVLVTVYFWYLATRYFRRFLHAQRQAMTAIGARQYDFRLPPVPNDEIGDLTHFTKDLALALQGSESFFVETLNNLPLLVFVLQADGTVVFVSKTALDTTGLALQDLEGTRFANPSWAWASAGNTLGSAVNWVLGRYLLHFQDRRWFPFKAKTLEVSQRWFQKYGVWSLLMAWLPVGGDALTFIAGVMRVRFVIFFALTAVGKSTRYAILLGIMQAVG